MNLHAPWNGGNFSTIWGTVSFWRSARSCGVTCYQHRSFSLVHICVRKIFVESNRRKCWVPLIFTTLQYMCVNRGYLANCYAEEMVKLQQNCRWILQIYWQYLSYVALWVKWICIKQRTLCTQVLQIPTFLYCCRLSVMLCVLVCIQIILGLIWNKSLSFISYSGDLLKWI